MERLSVNGNRLEGSCSGSVCIYKLIIRLKKTLVELPRTRLIAFVTTDEVNISRNASIQERRLLYERSRSNLFEKTIMN